MPLPSCAGFLQTDVAGKHVLAYLLSSVCRLADFRHMINRPFLNFRIITFKYNFEQLKRMGEEFVWNLSQNKPIKYPSGAFQGDFLNSPSYRSRADALSPQTPTPFWDSSGWCWTYLNPPHKRFSLSCFSSTCLNIKYANNHHYTSNNYTCLRAPCQVLAAVQSFVKTNIPFQEMSCCLEDFFLY